VVSPPPDGSGHLPVDPPPTCRTVFRSRTEVTKARGPESPRAGVWVGLRSQVGAISVIEDLDLRRETGGAGADATRWVLVRPTYLPVGSRWLHPGQQHGRRWPSSSSSWVRRMRRLRVICCLASSTQQMNSLRAKGVMSFQAARAVELAISALRRSSGSLCTTPPGTRLLVTEESRSASGLRQSRDSTAARKSRRWGPSRSWRRWSAAAQLQRLLHDRASSGTRDGGASSAGHSATSSVCLTMRRTDVTRMSEAEKAPATWSRLCSYPRRAASIVATSIFFMDIMAEKARFASAPPAARASVRARGVICQDRPQRSLHQPH
jgi:hypothetical protein